MKVAIITIFATALVCHMGYAYPEYQKYYQTTSGRFINCAMCHVHPDGPDGGKRGQIGSLSTEELAQLGRARAALTPGMNATSPILSHFGNVILNKVGKSNLLLFKQKPEQLVLALDQKSDLDRDGITDAIELAEGTNPSDANHGDPWRLLVNNMKKYAIDLVVMLFSTLLLIYAFQCFISYFELKKKR